MTQVSIAGTEFHLDGRSTYLGREFEGHRIQGLLFNVRAVQATFRHTVCHQSSLFPQKQPLRGKTHR